MIATVRRFVLVLSALLALHVPTSATADAAVAWQALAEGQAVMLMRHALAPGVGDPPDFNVADCTTQRNLSEAGREQARAIGRALRENLGSSAVEVFSSAWCRCLETGKLLGLGEVQPLHFLNSSFRDRELTSQRSTALFRWLQERVMTATTPAVLVSHQVNVTAATGVYPASGEAVIVAADGEVLHQVLLADP